MIFLLAVLGILYGFLVWPRPTTVRVTQVFEIPTQNFGPLKIDLHITLVMREKPEAEALFKSMASSALNRWVLSWDGTIAGETYAEIERLVRDIPAPDLRVTRVIVASVVLPAALPQKKTPAERARSTLDSAIETVQALHAATNELSEKKDFWEDEERGGVIRKLLISLKHTLTRYEQGP